MRQANAFSPGWLREEIGVALQEVTRLHGISEGLKNSFRDVAAAIERSDSLKRPGGSVQQSASVPADSRKLQSVQRK